MVDWAINLASQNTQRNYRPPQRKNQCLNHHSPPVASPPVVLNLDIPRINQANSSKPIYPSIRGPLVSSPASRQQSTSSEDEDFIDTQVPAYCYYPKTIYIGEALPTRSPRALRAFKQHCRLQYDQSRVTLVLDQPLNHICEFTSSPLNLQNILWKGHTTVAYFSIFEEYYWICHQTRPNVPDRAILQPAYKVHYPWNNNSWSITRLPRIHPVNEQQQN